MKKAPEKTGAFLWTIPQDSTRAGTGAEETELGPDAGVGGGGAGLGGEGETELLGAGGNVDIDELLHVLGLHTVAGEDLLAVGKDAEGDGASVGVAAFHAGVALDLVPGAVKVEGPIGADGVLAAGLILNAIDGEGLGADVLGLIGERLGIEVLKDINLGGGAEVITVLGGGEGDAEVTGPGGVKGDGAGLDLRELLELALGDGLELAGEAGGLNLVALDDAVAEVGARQVGDGVDGVEAVHVHVDDVGEVGGRR